MHTLRVRFKVWQVMAIAALVAVLLAPIIWRQNFCLRMAAMHAQEELAARAQVLRVKTLFEQQLALFVAQQHAGLRSRYQRVAFRPWEPLPDDPSPEFGGIASYSQRFE